MCVLNCVCLESEFCFVLGCFVRKFVLFGFAFFVLFCLDFCVLFWCVNAIVLCFVVLIRECFLRNLKKLPEVV